MTERTSGAQQKRNLVHHVAMIGYHPYIKYSKSIRSKYDRINCEHGPVRNETMEEEYVKITLTVSGEGHQKLIDLINSRVGEGEASIGGDADELSVTCKKSISEKVLSVIHENQYDKFSEVQVHPIHKSWL